VEKTDRVRESQNRVSKNAGAVTVERIQRLPKQQGRAFNN
jgi:hypothetical protein